MSRALQETPQPTMRGTEGMLAGPMSWERVIKKERGGTERGNVSLRHYPGVHCLTNPNALLLLTNDSLFYCTKIMKKVKCHSEMSVLWHLQLLSSCDVYTGFAVPYHSALHGWHAVWLCYENACIYPITIELLLSYSNTTTDLLPSEIVVLLLSIAQEHKIVKCKSYFVVFF